MEDAYEQLDVTPYYTFTTLQTPYEALNAVIVAILTSFVIAGLNHFIIKLITATYQNTFNFESWLRVHIFSYSDDIIRIMRWILGASPETPFSWNPWRSKVHLSRLKWPLIARFLLLLSSVGSIIIAIPRERQMEPCNVGDFHIFLSTSERSELIIRDGLLARCSRVPLESSLGRARSTLAICSSRYIYRQNLSIGPSSSASKILAFEWELFGDSETGLFAIGILNREEGSSVHFTWEALWKGDPENDLFLKRFKTKDFRTPFPRPQGQIVRNLTILVQDSTKENCSNVNLLDEDSDSDRLYYEMDCDNDVKSEDLLAIVERTFASRIGWEKKKEISKRIPLMTNDVGKAEQICPIQVSVERPILNMFQLFLLWILMCLLNLVINWHLRKRSSVLDEVFLLLKDTLGYDMAANPLQVDSGTPLKLKKAKCVGCQNNYVGYLRWQNDDDLQALNYYDVSSCECEVKLLARQARIDRNRNTQPVDNE